MIAAVHAARPEPAARAAVRAPRPAGAAGAPCPAPAAGAVRRARALAALAAAAVLLAAAAACARPDPTAAEVVRAGSLRFIPRDAAGIAVVEAARIEDRAALARLLGGAAGGLDGSPALAPLRALFGGDDLGKVDRLALALVPAPGETAGWAVLVEGRFDRDRLGALARDGSIATLIEVSGGMDISLTVLPGGCAAVGPRAVLERIRSVVDRPAEGLEQGPLPALLATVSPQAHAWGAIDYDPLARFAAVALGGSGLALPPPRTAGALRGVAFEGRIGDEVDFMLVGVADAEAGAESLADGARGLVALARMGAAQGKDREWLAFLDGLRIDQEGSEIRLHGLLGRGMLDAFAARLTAPPGPGSPTGAPSGAAPGPVAAPPGTDPAPAAPRR